MNWPALRSRLRWCWRQLLTLALLALVLAAVVVGVGRQLVPAVGDYRADVEARLSAEMGLPVRLEVLQGKWEGLGPRFLLRGLQLRDPAQPAQTLLRIPEIELRPSLWQSLRYWEPRVDVRLRGLDIHLDQQPDGRLQIRELAAIARSDPHAAEQALRFALRQPALALTESRLGLALQNHPVLILTGLNLVNRNAGQQHQLAGQFQVPGSAEAVGLQLELLGDPLRWQQSRLTVHLHLPVLRLDTWLPPAEAEHMQLTSLNGGGDYWLHFQQGRLQALQAWVDWRDMEFTAAQSRHHLQNLTGLVSWSQSTAGWQLAASQLQGRIDDQPWPVSALALRREGERMTWAAAQVNVAAARQLLRSFALSPALAGWLQEASPEGELLALRADLRRGSGGHWQPQRIDVQARNLNARATMAYPGAKGLSAWVRWTPGQAWLGLTTKTAELDLHQFLREPVAIHALQGNLRWQADARYWRINSDHLQLSNADAKGTALLSVEVPRADPAAARLSLLGTLQQARAASAWRYVPWTVAGDETLGWLRRSILGGTVSRADILYEGPVHKREDLGPPRLFMQFALEGGRLDYAPGWPELRQLNASITVDDKRLEMQGAQARLLDASRGHKLQALVPDLHQPVLMVAGDVSSNGSDLMRLFRESPLRSHIPGLTDALDMQGEVNGNLSLRLPLAKGSTEKMSLAVAARLQDNRLQLKQADLLVSALSGDIGYSTSTGLTAPALQAHLLEAPVTARMTSQVRRGEFEAVEVSVSGRASVPALRRWLGSPLLDVISGSAPYLANIHIAGADARSRAEGTMARIRLQLDSSLAGLRVDMPAPLGKAANESRPLRYQSTLGAGEQLARLQYGRRLAAGLVWQDGNLDRALLRLEGSEAAWPEQRGIEIEGRMTQLDLRAWSPWLQRFRRPPTSGSVALKGKMPLPTLTRLELDAAEVVAEGLRLQNAHIGLNRDGPAWRLRLASDELEGRLLWPDNPTAEAQVSFSRLHWPLPGNAGNAGNTVTVSPVAGLGTRPLLVAGAGLRLAAWPGLGPLGLKARLLPSPYGLRIEDITLDSQVLNFQGRLDWQWRGGISTRLRGHASSEDVAGLLKAMDYAPSLVSPKASAEIDLAWHGPPDKPVPAALEGELALIVEQGRLLNVSNSTSASRVFGWFDLDNIRRRFKGDFSDVLRRGLSFDKASLAGPVQAGVMMPAAFLVDGPTLKATGQGRLDLGKKQMDQDFTVVVPVSSAVPIAAVVVAGPLLGGVVAAAQMAFQKQINKVTQLRYHVSGDWANPRVERLNMKILDFSGNSRGPAAPGGSTPLPGSIPVTNQGARP